MPPSRVASVVSTLVLFVLLLAPSPTVAAECTPETFGLLATDPTVSLCMVDSKIPLLTMESRPTADQLRVVCQTPTCRQLLQMLVALNAPECTLPIGGRLHIRADLVDPAVVICAQVDRSHGSAAASRGQEQTVGKDQNTSATGTLSPPTSGSSSRWTVAQSGSVRLFTALALVRLFI